MVETFGSPMVVLKSNLKTRTETDPFRFSLSEISKNSETILHVPRAKSRQYLFEKKKKRYDDTNTSK